MARARGGTIVLDEIGDLTPEAQGRVVRMMDAPGEDRARFHGNDADQRCDLPCEEAGVARGSVLPSVGAR